MLATVGKAATGLGLLVPEAGITALPANQHGEIALKASKKLCAAIESCDSFVLGLGMSDGKHSSELVCRLLSLPREDLSVVLDAAAIMGAAGLATTVAAHQGRLVMTPNLGELASLLDEDIERIEQSPEPFAREGAARFGAIMVVKAAVTFIAHPDGHLIRFEGKCLGLATSGSGDVLAGIIAGLMARGASPLTAAGWGVWLHNAAGRELARTMGIGILARELVGQIALMLERTEKEMADAGKVEPTTRR